MYDEEKIISVCVVQGEENFITRIADVLGNELEIPKVDHSKEYKGFNRDKLYYNRLDYPRLREGHLGVWKWRVSQNRMEPDKDWVLSDFQKDPIPIEIIDNFRNNTKEEMIVLLQKGMPLGLCDHRRLLLFRNGSCEQGVLCDSSKLEQIDSEVRVKNDVYGLPCYDIDENNFIRTQWTRDVQELCLYRFFQLPQPSGYLFVRSPAEVVKKLLKERLNWRFVSDNGGKRKDFSSLRKLIETLPVNGLTEDIAAHCHCSESNAAVYWDEFLAAIDQYIHSGDIETQVLQGLLNEDESLRERLHEEWRKTNQQKIEKEETEYHQRRTQLEIQLGLLKKERNLFENNFIEFQNDQQTELDRLRNEIEKAKACLNKAQEEAKLYEVLGREGLQKVRDKLSLAREEAAEFLADLALFGSPREATTFASSASPTSPALRGHFLPGVKPDECEHVEDNKALLEELWENLKKAGADKKRIPELAAFLYGAFLSRTSLLLTGPQGALVADALSCAMAGRHVAVLDCYDEWNPAILDEIMRGGDEVVVVKHPFQNRWIDHLIPELDSTGKMWIFVHPYADDLPLEPSGLFQYLLPLVLDPFILHSGDGDMTCCRRGKNYSEFPENEKINSTMGPLRKLTRSCYLEMKVRRLMIRTYGVPEKGDKIFLRWGCLLFPIAVALGRKDIFLESIQGDPGLSPVDRVFLENCIGDFR